MSFKNAVFFIFIIFISACASTNTKNDISSSSLIAKDDMLYESEAINLDKSEVAFIYIGKFISVKKINDKKVPIQFFKKDFRKFVTLPGEVSITFDYGIDEIEGLPRYKAKLEAGRGYVFLGEEKAGDGDNIYFGLYDAKSKNLVGGF